MEIRIVHQIKGDAEEEAVYFTENLDDPIEDLQLPGWEIASDYTIEVDNWPSTFPMDETLFKR